MLTPADITDAASQFETATSGWYLVSLYSFK